MASRFTDRLLTIVITATLTSAAWIVIGSSYVNVAGNEDARAGGNQAPAASPSQPAASEEGGLIIPVQGVSATKLTDAYADPRGEGERLHEAIDIPAPAGTPIVAAAPGIIERLFNSEEGGNTIYVRSNDRRTIHYYAHLQDYAPGLEERQKVRQGQRLGTVGSSGNADPAVPHLHFAIMRADPDQEWWEAETAVNPYPLLRGR